MPARRNVALDGAEEGGVAKHTAQGVNCEGTAFVHAVVEHQVRARVGKQQVLRQAGQNIIVVAGRDGCMHPVRVLAPQPLRVAGETLIEPNVIPLGKAHRIAKPLVAELVGDQALPCLIARHVIPAKNG